MIVRILGALMRKLRCRVARHREQPDDATPSDYVDWMKEQMVRKKD